jgi:hypothetical protein
MSISTAMFAMEAAITDYVAHQRAIGRGYRSEERILLSMCHCSRSLHFRSLIKPASIDGAIPCTIWERIRVAPDS